MHYNSEADALTQTIIRVVRDKKPKNMNQLVFLVQKQLPNTDKQILDEAQNLQDQGKIKLEKLPIPPIPDLVTYAKTSALWFWATIAIATLTVTVVFIVPENLYPWSYLRNALGAIFVLWLPGYTSIKILFPVHVPMKMSSENLDIIERIALSIGTSIGLVPLVSLLLNYTPWGIGLAQIVLSLFALTLIFATVALIREHQTKIRIQT